MIQRDLTILSQPPTYILLELHIILISLIIYKPLTLIISPQIFSMQLGAGTSLFYLSQYAIPFCTLSLLCSLSTTVYAAVDSVAYQITLLPSNNSLYSYRQYCLLDRFSPFQQQSVQLQIVLSIRLLCSLSIIVCATTDNIVHQITLLPSNNGLCSYKQCCSLGRFALF